MSDRIEGELAKLPRPTAEHPSIDLSGLSPDLADQARGMLDELKSLMMPGAPDSQGTMPESSGVRPFGPRFVAVAEAFSDAFPFAPAHVAFTNDARAGDLCSLITALNRELYGPLAFEQRLVAA